MVFKNELELKKFLSEKCAQAVANVEEKVYEEFAGNLNQFYVEFHPEEYIRTGALFNSLEATGVTKSISGATAEVRFDIPGYKNGLVPLQSGNYGYANWSGEHVLEVALEGGYPHGGYQGGTAIWTESMEKLGGESGIKNLLKQELSKQGL